jgi:membrane associated rhomboid family serine protease
MFGSAQLAPMTVVLLHPLIHGNLEHLASNILGLTIMGSLVEVGMTRLRRRYRYAIFAYCYLLSVGLSYFNWQNRIVGSGDPAVGLSGMIFAALPFTVFYFYFDLFSREFYRGRKIVIPVGIWLVLALFVLPFVLQQTGYGITLVSNGMFLHLFAFLPSFVLAHFTIPNYRNLRES